MSGQRVSVDADALRQVLLAMMGPGHLIRELQATISISELTGKPHPVKVLLKDFHDATNAPAPAQQEPDCPRCKGSGEDPEGYFDTSRGPDGGTHDGPCRDCAGTGAAQHQEPPQQERKPMADAAAEAFNNTFHKVRAEVSMDWWQRIWAKGAEWAQQGARSMTATATDVKHLPSDDTEGGAT